MGSRKLCYIVYSLTNRHQASAVWGLLVETTVALGKLLLGSAKFVKSLSLTIGLTPLYFFILIISVSFILI